MSSVPPLGAFDAARAGSKTEARIPWSWRLMFWRQADLAQVADDQFYRTVLSIGGWANACTVALLALAIVLGILGYGGSALAGLVYIGLAGAILIGLLCILISKVASVVRRRTLEQVRASSLG